MHEPGMTLSGRYRITRRIGAGGMGQVFEARDLVLKEPVALKVISENLAADPVSTKRMLSEAKLMSRLNHPGIVRVRDVLTDKDRMCLVLEYIDGSNLQQFIDDGLFTDRFGQRMIRRLGGVLAYMHDNYGIIHRDIKPTNVMVRNDGSIKLVDFGIAISPLDEKLTKTGFLVGTRDYMAPEVRRGQPATSASDIWSFGAVLRAAYDSLPAAQRPSGQSAAHKTIQRMLDIDPARRPTPAALMQADFGQSTVSEEHRGSRTRSVRSQRTKVLEPSRQADVEERTVEYEEPGAAKQVPDRSAASFPKQVQAKTLSLRKNREHFSPSNRLNGPLKTARLGRAIVTALAAATALLVAGLVVVNFRSAGDGARAAETAASASASAMASEMETAGFSNLNNGLFIKWNTPPKSCRGADATCASLQMVSTAEGGCQTGAWVMAYLASSKGKLIAPLASTSPPLPQGKPVDVYIGAESRPSTTDYTFEIGPTGCSHER